MILGAVDTNQVRVLPNHHPLWANAANDMGPVAPDLPMSNLTLVLARPPQLEAAFKQLLADQQNPASPEYHHWLTPVEVGERFGLADEDLDAIKTWLQTQDLQVNWIADSKLFIGFGGTATDVGRAFQTNLHYYSVKGEQQLSVATDPLIPQVLTPAIRAIRGLYSIDDHPMHQMLPPHRRDTVPPGSPEFTNGSSYFLQPSDFATIYDLPSNLTGAGVTVGIVGRSRTDFADFSNFRTLTGATFPNPTEIVPTGGTDPGPAYTTNPNCSNECTGDQAEATLDVIRVGSTAPAANILLVVATNASGGIDIDAQYLVNTTPAPAKIMSISFGACESSAGTAGVDFWDALFQQAAAEGISVFVSSDDSGASGCDAAFAAPPAIPIANSPNYICSSTYTTCVGGTEFNDAGNPSLYWSTSGAALGYIPEGAWNEPLNSLGSTQVASSGGGVSTVITPTPAWQTGNGVPSARAGRYTPDISFSSSEHDGYFGCFAAGDGSCVNSGNGYSFMGFAGTSAAAPGMAGIAALLDQKLGTAQGNLSPEIYQLASGVPAAFHDATVASSGVSSCSVSTPSMCNNSIPSPSGLTGGQPGYLVTTGFDQVTGLGSLDVAAFLNSFATLPTVSSLTISPTTVTSGGSATLTIALSGTAPSGGAVVSLSSNNTSAFPVPASYTVPAGQTSASFTNGAGTVTTATIVAVTATYNSSSKTAQMTMNPPALPTVSSLGISPTTVTSGGSATLAITLSSAAPTGGAVVSLSSNNTSAFPVPGSYTVPAGQTSASFTNVAGTVTTSTIVTVTATYDSSSQQAPVTVNPATKTTPTITWSTPAPITYGTPLTAAQLDASASVPGSFTYSPSLGVVLNAGTQVLTASFTPTDTTHYNGASASVTLTVNKAAPVITWSTPASVPVGTALSSTQLDASANVPGTFTYSPATGTVMSTAGQTTLSVTFTPTNTTDYSTALDSVVLTVTSSTKTTPSITWSTPAPITYGTPLSTTQLNASASVAGSFSYSPAAGTVLNAGTQALTANFTPTDTTDYNDATGSVALTVKKATPIISWPTPASVSTGTALSSTQLDAATAVPGIFIYSPAAGTVLSTAGQTTLSVTFTPTNTTDYNNTSASVILTVTSPTKTTPSVLVTPSSSSITTSQNLSATVAIEGQAGDTPTGTIVLSGGGFASSAQRLSSGSTTFSIQAGSLAIGSDILTAVYTPDTSSSSAYNSATGSTQVTVTTATQASYSMSASPLTMVPGQSGGSTVTVSSTNGYSGTITLACSITASPTGANDLPTCSVSQTAMLSAGTTSATATVSIATTAATTGALARPNVVQPNGWVGAVGSTIAALLLLPWIPIRRRKWQSFLGVLSLVVTLGALGGCGSHGSNNGTTNPPINPGTTAGSYTVTVTGAGDDAAATKASTTFTVTVS